MHIGGRNTPVLLISTLLFAALPGSPFAHDRLMDQSAPLATVQFNRAARNVPPSPPDSAQLKSRLALLTTKVRQATAAFDLIASRPIMSFVIEPDSDRPLTELQVVYRELYYAASFTNRLGKSACLDRGTKHLCGNIFNPAWLVYPKDANPSIASMMEWTEETDRALDPLWRGLCTLAREKGAKDICVS